MRNRSLIAIILPSFLLGATTAGAVSTEEVRSLMAKYGKKNLIKTVLHLKANQITVQVNGTLREFFGAPDPAFVTPETLSRDLAGAQVDVEDLKRELEAITRPPKPAGQETPPKSEAVQVIRPVPPTVSPQREAVSHSASASQYEETASRPPSPPSPTGLLREAARDCDVVKFLDYMDPLTQQRVRDFEKIVQDVDEALDELYEHAQDWFGERVQRADQKVEFMIEGSDDRWVGLFGPQWARMIQRQPNRPRLLWIDGDFGWQAECQVLRNFQACQEDSLKCREISVEKSSLQMKKVEDTWRLVNVRSALDWEKSVEEGEGLRDILRWAKDHLEDHKGRMAYEDLMLSLAEGYLPQRQELAKQAGQRRM